MENTMTIQTYATRANKEYDSAESNFISLQQRLNEALDKAPHFRDQLDQVMKEFKDRNPQWVCWEDITLCESLETTLDKILVDTTMQRQPDIRHILYILDEFKETMVMSLQVYTNENGDDIAWDGQHTAIALYIIACLIYGKLPSQVKIPVVRYSITQKKEIRNNFIKLNGESKLKLDWIDTYKQMVYGVRVDGATDPEWVDVSEKNDILAEADMFATSKKFGDEDESGAFTLIAETVMSAKGPEKRKSKAVTSMFAEYWKRLGADRPVEQKEARQLFEYFNLCDQQNVDMQKHMSEFVKFVKQFEADFSPNGIFWSKVRNAYVNWYAEKNPDLYEEQDGKVRFSKEMPTAVPFLIEQLKKSTNIPTPKYVANDGFKPAQKDLW